MNPRISMGKTPYAIEVRPGRPGIYTLWLVRLAVLSIALAVSQASAQDCKKAGCNKGAGGKACGSATTGTGSQPAAPAQAASGAPKWSCAAPSVIAPPLWHGGQIDCTFQVRNQGDANLEIKVKGG